PARPDAPPASRSKRAVLSCFVVYVDGALGTGETARYRQALRAQEIGIEELALIARAVVGENGHDGVALAHLPGHANGARDIDPRRAAHAQPLMFEKVEYDWQRL